MDQWYWTVQFDWGIKIKINKNDWNSLIAETRWNCRFFQSKFFKIFESSRLYRWGCYKIIWKFFKFLQWTTFEYMHIKRSIAKNTVDKKVLSVK